MFEALEQSWQHFGGETEELLVDRAREMVLDPTVTPAIWNPRFLELCGHYGIRPLASRGHRPATKGRVERPFFYLEQHFSKGRSWPDMLALERDLARFESEWEQQPHQATGELPAVRFERDERALLRPLPSGPFISSEEEFREVSRDCLVSYRSVRYSVPWPYASRRVWLRPSPGMYLEVRNQAGTVLCAGPATSESAYRRQIGLAPPDSGSEASPGRRTGVARWLPYTANGTGSHVLRWIRWLKVVTL